MALRSRLQSMAGRLEETEDFTFDQLHDNYKALKAFAAKQQKEMTSYLEKSRAICYASVSSAEHYCAFFESSAGGATATSPAPQRRRITKGPNGYGMAIEDDGTVSGFTGQAGPAELAGVAIGMKIVAVNGVPTPGKACTIAQLHAIDKDEVEFTFEPPATAGLSAVSSTFGVTVREIKARNEGYSRDLRGQLEKTLIADVLEPLAAYIALFDAFQDLINDRQRARDVYDRYRAKVRDLGQSSSARDPARLPRNEQKMKDAYNTYVRCNAHATSQLGRFHRESVMFFGGLQRAYLEHQAAMFSAGHSTFESLLSLMTSALNEAGMSLKPVLPKVGTIAPARELEPEPECFPAVPATTSTTQPSLLPGGVSPTNPFLGADAFKQLSGQPLGVQAQPLMAQPVQTYPATASEAAPPAYSSTPGIPLVAAGAPGAGGTYVQPLPPPYTPPVSNAQPPPFQHPAHQTSPSWMMNVETAAPPPSYSRDPFAPVNTPASSDAAFSSGPHGMAPTAMSTASPFGHMAFDGTGGPPAQSQKLTSTSGGANANAGRAVHPDPFGWSATTSPNGFAFDEPTLWATTAPAGIAAVDFPANLPPHLGGPVTSRVASSDAASAQGAKTSGGGWQTFE